MSGTFDLDRLAGLCALLGQANQPPGGQKANSEPNIVLWVLLGIGIIVLLIIFVIFLSFIRLWIQAFLTGAKVGLFDMLFMRLRGVDYSKLVRWKIALVPPQPCFDAGLSAP